MSSRRRVNSGVLAEEGSPLMGTNSSGTTTSGPAEMCEDGNVPSLQLRNEPHKDVDAEPTSPTDMDSDEEARLRSLSIQHVVDGPEYDLVARTAMKENFQHTVKLVLHGQALALMVCGTGVCTQALNTFENVHIPTTQLLFAYITLAVTFGPVVLWNRHVDAYNLEREQRQPREGRDGGDQATSTGVETAESDLTDTPGEANTPDDTRTRQRLLKPAVIFLSLFAASDVLANVLATAAYSYTSLVSAQVLDCSSIPAACAASCLFLGQRYRWWQVIGVVVCLGGMAAVIGADVLTGRSSDGSAPNPAVGDVLSVSGALLYAMSNTAQAKVLGVWHDIPTILALLGCIASVLCAIVVAAMERDQLLDVTWTGQVVGLLAGFVLCLWMLYAAVAPYIRRYGIVAMNLSLLTADVYSMVAGLVIFEFQFSWLYILGFIVIIGGVALFNTEHVPSHCRCRKRTHSRIRYEPL